MTETLTVTIEPVDDLPVLLTAIARLGLAELVDQHFPRLGTWQDLNPGQMLSGWLAYILSRRPPPKSFTIFGGKLHTYCNRL